MVPEDSADSADKLLPGETLDAVYNGAVRLIQRKQGYRFSLDAVLLGDFASPARGRIVDLGTGCGVIPLIVAHRSPQARLVAVELQEGLAKLAERNVMLNGQLERVNVLCADLRALKGKLPHESFDLVLSNPPYRPARTGRLNPEQEKAIARHEVACELADVVRVACSLLKNGGRFKVVYPAARLTELFSALARHALRPRRMRLVHPKATEPAKLVLLEAERQGSSELEVVTPLVLHGPDGAFTAEVRRMLDAEDLQGPT
jgi:tRNA1Val (adenine37-N6)-methyltransferase